MYMFIAFLTLMWAKHTLYFLNCLNLLFWWSSEKKKKSLEHFYHAMLVPNFLSSIPNIAKEDVPWLNPNTNLWYHQGKVIYTHGGKTAPPILYIQFENMPVNIAIMPI